MTRINIIDPRLLADQHLVAEYRETPMVPAALRRTIKSARGFSRSRIPNTYTLNAGHVTFFYDKLAYLSKRYDSLIVEMKRRGMNPDPGRTLALEELPDECFNDWSPDPSEQMIVAERIGIRLMQRAGWYRYNGQVANVEVLIDNMKQYILKRGAGQ